MNINELKRKRMRDDDVELSAQIGRLNWSDVQSALIVLAARLCDQYQSDIIHDIGTIQRAIDEKQSCRIVCGFREYGVDGNAYVILSDKERYRALWVVDIEHDEYNVRMNFWEARL